MAKRSITLEVESREVRVTNPDKLYFPNAGHTKLDVVRYYLAVAGGVLRGIGGRPLVLRRHVHGAEGDAFFQKRAPKGRPDWIETVVLSFPSGRTAEEVVVNNAAQLAWLVNLGCIEQHPHPVRAKDLDHPDELRIDLDPVPGVEWQQVLDVAAVTREVLEELELVGWPKTSGSRGMHINVRIEPRWGFSEVRRAALAIAREVERRAPKLATSAWWKEERHGVFLDFNQNAKDRTVSSAYSVRPTPDARVSMPLRWSQVSKVDPADFTVSTVPAVYARNGDAGAGIDEAVCSLEPTLELVARQETDGLGDAPWPPHYKRQSGEPRRAPPSRRKQKSGAPQKTRGPQKSRALGRQSRMPLLTVANAKQKDDALAGFERWKAKYPEAAEQLEPADVLVDSMRGRSSTWTRIRVNLQHVPEGQHPPQETPDPDYDPWEAYRKKSRKGSGKDREEVD